MIEEIRFIHFDFDDTLINVGELHFEAFQNALNTFNAAIDFRYEDLAGFETVNAFQFLGFSKNDSEKLSIIKSEIFQSLSAIKKPSWNNGILDLLDTLDELNIDYSVVSSGSRHRIINTLAQLNASDRFSFVITKDDVPHNKPHPDPYILAVTTSKIPINNSLAVEDSFNGYTSALSAGLDVWQLTGAGQTKLFANKHGPASILQKWLTDQC